MAIEGQKRLPELDRLQPIARGGGGSAIRIFRFQGNICGAHIYINLAHAIRLGQRSCIQTRYVVHALGCLGKLAASR
jgi:hypothetical protein